MHPTHQPKIDAAQSRLDAAAKDAGLPGLFDVTMQSDGRWAVRYWWGRSRPVTNKQPSIDAAVERALLWILDAAAN